MTISFSVSQATILRSNQEIPARAGRDMELAAHRLREIPPGLIDVLREAAVLLDAEKCINAAVMIADHDHEVAHNLRRMVEGMQYREILTALDNLPKGPSP